MTIIVEHYSPRYGLQYIPRQALRLARSGLPQLGCRRLQITQRAGCREQLARLEQRLQPGKDHRPAAVELRVGSLAQLIVNDHQAARVANPLDLPCDPRRALALHVVAPQRSEALDETARRGHLQVLALEDRRGW